MAITGSMQINGPNVGLVTLVLTANSPTPTDLATFNDVVTILDGLTSSPSPVEQQITFLNTWVLNNPNYGTVPSVIETAETTAEITSIQIGEVVR